MPFKMKVSNTKIEGQEVVPPNIYELKLVTFNPKQARVGNSINLNPVMEIVNNPEFAGRKIFDTLNTGGAWTYPDFCHAFGLPMETDGADSWLPGEWDGDPSKFNKDDASTWKYKGPLLGRTAKVEVAVDNYNGRDNNKVRRYFCAVADCSSKFPKIKHSEDLLKKSK